MKNPTPMPLLPRGNGTALSGLPSVDGFQIERLLGEGAMATVYLARQDGLDRLVALKVLRSDRRANDDLVSRFEAEARILGGLDNINLVAVFDFVSFGRTPCFVMEYVDGETLADAHRAGTLTVGRFLEVLRCCGEALDVAHRAGVIHRDVKPGNVLLPVDGGAKLGDFGLALHQPAGEERNADDEGLSIGTPLYMAPEQSDAATSASVESDIYSLAAAIHELLTDAVPQADHEAVTALNNSIATLKTDELLTAALSRDPRDRPSDVLAFTRDIEASLRPEVLVQPDQLISAFRRGRRRGGWWIRSIVMFSLFVTAAGLLYWIRL